MTQETANNIINMARVTVHGTQGPKIILHKSLVKILIGTMVTHGSSSS